MENHFCNLEQDQSVGNGSFEARRKPLELSVSSRSDIELYSGDERDKSFRLCLSDDTSEDTSSDCGPIMQKRRKLYQSERDLLKTTFDHLGKSTLLARDILSQKECSKDFQKMFDDIKVREGHGCEKKTISVIQSSYRALKRNKKTEQTKAETS